VSEIVKAWVEGRDYDFSDYTSYMSDQWLRRDWDNGLPQPSFWREVHRVLKPGAHTLVFAAPRTADLVALSLRLAGFEVRDTIVWVHRQGFGMGMNVARTLAMREVRSRLSEDDRRTLHSRRRRFPSRAGRAVMREGLAIDREGILEIAPGVAPLLDQYDGVATKVRPAHETIIVARKPTIRSVAENTLRHGVGGMFVKPTRTRSSDGKQRYPSNMIGDLGDEHQPFFFAPKVTPEERDRHLPPGVHNTHHAVKPIELLRWLIRLVVPEGGTVLDPFLGSGSTGCACVAERMNFIGIEREADYAGLGRARIEGWAKAKRAGGLS
jgi:DNA modification methylase